MSRSELPNTPCRLVYLETGARQPGFYVVAFEADDPPAESQIFAQVREPWTGMIFAQSHTLLAVAEDIVEMDDAARLNGGQLVAEDWSKVASAARAVVELARDTPPIKRRRTLLSDKAQGFGDRPSGDASRGRSAA